MPYERRFFFISFLLVAISYIWGLSEVQIPKIGDEVLYLQIARVTDESSSLLPLRYEEGVWSTKPPLLYWLGIFSSKVFGPSLWAYRLPVLLITFLGAWLVYLLGIIYLEKKSDALWASLAYLGFISTFQHGRPFLVNSFEVLFLVFPLYLFFRNPQLTFTNCLLTALSWGAVAWSKSFALIVVGAFSLLTATHFLLKTSFLKRSFYFAAASILALGVFATWFLLDPDPRLLFQQFVVGENVAKFKGYADYFSGLFVGSYTLFRIWLGPFANAGLYAILLAALLYLLFKNFDKVQAQDKALLVFVFSFLIFYSLPTQRQENYLLPAMAALALLLAKFRDKIPEFAWKFSLGLTDLAFIVLSLAPWILSLWWEFSPFAKVLWVLCVIAYPVIYFIWDTRLSFPLLVLMCFIQITNFSDPFNRDFKSFEQNKANVWVPSRKLAQHEKFRFMAPNSIPAAYAPDSLASLCSTLKAGDFVIVDETDLALCARPVEKIESVLDFKTRQKPLELLKIAFGKSEYLVRKLTLLRIQE